MPSPVVVDLSQWNEVADFAAVKAAGIQGVIHKATQGTTKRDSKYAAHKKAAKAAGLLFGSYHYLEAGNVAAQAEHFLAVAAPEKGELIALDFEEYKNLTPSLADCRDWLKIVSARTGVKPVLYSGSLLKSLMKVPDVFICSHRLWLPEYGEHAHLPVGFKKYWLHQFTGDGNGPGPHEIPGIVTKGIDLSAYSGENLALDWAGIPFGPPPPLDDTIPAPPRPTVIPPPTDGGVIINSDGTLTRLPLPGDRPIPTDSRTGNSLGAMVHIAWVSFLSGITYYAEPYWHPFVHWFRLDDPDRVLGFLQADNIHAVRNSIHELQSLIVAASPALGLGVVGLVAALSLRGYMGWRQAVASGRYLSRAEAASASPASLAGGSSGVVPAGGQ